MNTTNRLANRFLLLLVGLIVLLAGLSAIALAQIPALTGWWNRHLSVAMNTVMGRRRLAAVSDSGAPWGLVGVLALLVVLIVLLVVFVGRHGGGRTNRLITRQTDEDGTTIVDAAVAAELLREALARRPELLAVHVSAYRAVRVPTLKITVTCRRGTSPKSVSETIEELLLALDRVLGAEVPALVQIGGGFRARLAASARLDAGPAESSGLGQRPRELAAGQSNGSPPAASPTRFR